MIKMNETMLLIIIVSVVMWFMSLLFNLFMDDECDLIEK